MSEENKALIRRLYEEVWNQHNPEAADEFVAPDVFTRDMVPEHQHGIDGYKHLVRWMHTAIPDLRYDTEEIIAEGDKVATFVTFSGTHTGPIQAPYGTLIRAGGQFRLSRRIGFGWLTARWRRPGR